MTAAYDTPVAAPLLEETIPAAAAPPIAANDNAPTVGHARARAVGAWIHGIASLIAITAFVIAVADIASRFDP